MVGSAEPISTNTKLPPQALEAEQSLLGGLLLHSMKWDDVVDVVSATDFYHKNHRLIFEAIRGLQDANDAVDVITVGNWLKEAANLEKVGGFAYISKLANDTPGAANIMTYAKIVRERAILRSLTSAANDISDNVYNPKGRTSREILDHAEGLIFDISERDGRGRGGFVSLQTLVDESAEVMEEQAKSGKDIIGISTGFIDLDKITSGFQRGDLIIVAGRPSMGKTSFSLNIAESVAIEEKLTVAVFSLEMPGQQLAMRLLSSNSGVPLSKIRSGNFTDADWGRLNPAMRWLKNSSMYIDSSVSLTPLELRSRARRLARQHDVGLIIIDYLQLIEASNKSDNRATEISGITRAMKSLAKELNVPVVALSQLNRSVESRPNKRPVMADLRESGAIEQDADVILFIYRDEVYNEDSEHKGIAEIIISKQRNGPIGTIRLTFNGTLTRFNNYAAQPA